MVKSISSLYVTNAFLHGFYEWFYMISTTMNSTKLNSSKTGQSYLISVCVDLHTFLMQTYQRFHMAFPRPFHNHSNLTKYCILLCRSAFPVGNLIALQSTKQLPYCNGMGSCTVTSKAANLVVGFGKHAPSRG